LTSTGLGRRPHHSLGHFVLGRRWENSVYSRIEASPHRHGLYSQNSQL